MAGAARQELQGRAAAAVSEANPAAAEGARLQTLRAEATASLDAVKLRQKEVDARVDTLGHLDAAFGRTGVQSYALEGILGELQVPAPACMPPASQRQTKLCSCNAAGMSPCTHRSWVAAALAASSTTLTVVAAW